MEETEPTSGQRLDERVDEIGERVATIEGKMDDTRKPLHKRIADYGGLVALVLSITLGVYTLYDKLLVQPASESLRMKADLRDRVRELAEIVARIAGFDWSNQQAAGAQAQALTPQRIALREEIIAADRITPGVLKFADRLLLANEYEFFGALEEALDQARLLDELATDSAQRANSAWAQARMYGRMADQARMRELYASALDQFKEIGLVGTAGSVMQIYTQWVATELAVGTCPDAAEVHARMVEDFWDPGVYLGTRQGASSEFARMLSQAPRTCDLSPPM